MKTLWSYINLPDMPYVYQEISVNGNCLYITFGIVGNHDFELSFCKEYETRHIMETSFLDFRQYTDNKEDIEWPQLTEFRGGDKVQLNAQLDLIEKAMNNQLDLPDQGIGFRLITDMENLKYCHQGCLEALNKFNHR